MVAVNVRKSIRLKNRTKYFSPDTSRSNVRFSSPESYQSRQIKIEGYETRLYYQFDYCQVLGGQTFFYTLTYCERSMPKRYGVSCFDYENLRDLFTGGFRKKLLRTYGTRFKYFVGAELGDGKGERGLHNNPHYHVLFFLEPYPYTYYRYEYRDVPVGFYQRNTKFHRKGDVKFQRKREKIAVIVPYKKISPQDFRHLIRLYWQGFDESDSGFRDYKDCKYGIAREGENLGLVTDFRACCYCAKYVCKDAQLKMNESNVERIVRYREIQRAKDSSELYQRFFRSVVFDMFNTPLNSKRTVWSFDDRSLFVSLLPESFRLFFDIYGEVPQSVIDSNYIKHVIMVIRKFHLWDKFHDFLDKYVEDKVHCAVCEYRNRYCNKCRISHGVGDYALTKIQDKLNPIIRVPSKHGFKNRPLSQYYYRKLFCDVVHTGFSDDSGKEYTCYMLNDDGIRYKVSKLRERVEKMVVQARNNLAFIYDDESLFDLLRSSDVNTDVRMTFSDFRREYDKLKNYNIDIFERYAVYKLVYEDRFFKVPVYGSDDVFDFPCIDVLGDYQRFLVSSVLSVSRSDLRLDSFLDGNCQGYLPYSQHPYFLRYLGIFRVLDLCADYWFCQNDAKAQREAEEIAATKRFHNKLKLKEFYSQFKLVQL